MKFKIFNKLLSLCSLLSPPLSAEMTFKIKAPDQFQVESVYQVAEDQGSWVCIKQISQVHAQYNLERSISNHT